jgi:hypothetical protein
MVDHRDQSQKGSENDGWNLQSLEILPKERPKRLVEITAKARDDKERWHIIRSPQIKTCPLEAIYKTIIHALVLNKKQGMPHQEEQD